MIHLTRRDILGTCALLAATGGTALASSPDLKHLGLIKPPLAIDSPVLEVPDLSGRHHRIGDYRGKILVVSFWATWCPPCRKEMPTLARLSRDLGTDDYAVLAVNVGDREDKIRSFLDEIDHEGLPVLMDSDGRLPGKWYLRGLPVTYVLDRTGKVILGAIGERIWDAPEMIAGLKSLG